MSGGGRGGDADKLQLALALLNLVAARAGDPSVGGGGLRRAARRASELLLEHTLITPPVIRSTGLLQIHCDFHVSADFYLRPRGVAHRRVRERVAALGHTGIDRGALAHNADTNVVVEDDGYTALLSAVVCGKPDAVQLLLDSNVDLLL